MSREWLTAISFAAVCAVISVLPDVPLSIQMSAWIAANVFFAASLVITAIDRKAKK